MIVLNITEEIHVRPMAYDDIYMYKWIRDKCLPYIHDDKSYTVEETINWFLTTRPQYLTVSKFRRVIGYFRISKLTSFTCHVGMDLDPDHRGKGIALKTYTEVINKLNKIGITYFYLSVLENNTHAIRLYQHLGFKKIHDDPPVVRSNGDIINSITMVKKVWK